MQTWGGRTDCLPARVLGANEGHGGHPAAVGMCQKIHLHVQPRPTDLGPWGAHPRCALHTGGLTAPLPPSVLDAALSHPQWQLWSSPCHQGHSRWCSVTKDGCVPGGCLAHTTPSCLPFHPRASRHFPRASQGPLVCRSVLQWPSNGHPLPVTTQPGGQCWCPCSAADESPPRVTLSRPFSSTQSSPCHLTCCSRWWR